MNTGGRFALWVVYAACALLLAQHVAGFSAGTGAFLLGFSVACHLAACVMRLRPARGWVVREGRNGRFRTWEDGWSSWTADPARATYYARREDAEAVHAEDEDAWCVEERWLP